MKTILVCTDFSAASDAAVRYGVEMATEFNAKVILFHAYQLASFAVTDSSIVVNTDDIDRAVFSQLEDQARMVNRVKNFPVYVDGAEGPVISTILKKAGDENADVIITGMKTDHNILRRILGSTINGLLRKTSIPVIVVPDDTAFRKIETIALAFESDAPENINPHLLDSFREIAERFHSAVYAVRVSGKKIHDSFEFLLNPNRLIKMIRTTDPKIKYVHDVDVQEGLIHFIEDFYVDMLGILPRHLAGVDRLFSKSTTERLMRKTPIPLLILPETFNQKKSNEMDVETAGDI